MAQARADVRARWVLALRTLCLHQRCAWTAPSHVLRPARASSGMAEPGADPPVDLGFAETVLEPWRLRSPYFPSKVGGRPAWLGETGLPGPEALQCAGCGRPCAFLLQVYAPLRPPRAFHRSLYIFCCIQPACHLPRDPRPFRVFRNQLPRKNDTYSYDPPPDAAPLEGTVCSIVQLKSGAHLCRVCGALAPKGCSKCHLAHYCCKAHQVVDWKLAHRNQCCVQPELCDAAIPDHGFLFPEYEIITEPEELESEDENEKETGEQNEEKYAEAAIAGMGTVAESLDEKDLEAMAKHETEEDKIFEHFKKIIAPQPKQVLRYSRGGEPLWISGEHIPQETDIPNCSCGAKRIFEFQVMPQLLNYLNVDSLGTSIDWGTLAVYTCAESCNHEKQYAEEFLWRQDLAV